MSDDEIPLTDVGPLMQPTYGEMPPNFYRRLYMAALDGRVPFVRRHGRVYLRAADLPQVATLFRLTALSHAA